MNAQVEGTIRGLCALQAFARLCGVAPLPASSGKTNRHRVNRSGDRIAKQRAVADRPGQDELRF
jgi:transposase